MKIFLTHYIYFVPSSLSLVEHTLTCILSTLWLEQPGRVGQLLADLTHVTSSLLLIKLVLRLPSRTLKKTARAPPFTRLVAKHHLSSPLINTLHRAVLDFREREREREVYLSNRSITSCVQTTDNILKNQANYSLPCLYTACILLSLKYTSLSD